MYLKFSKTKAKTKGDSNNMSTIEVEKETEVDCPHCKQKFDLTVKQKKPKVEIQEQETVKELKNNTEVHDHSHSEKPKPDEHQEIANSMPKGNNFAYCTGPDCGKKIVNAKGIVTKFKKCSTCGANTVPKSKKYCPTCGTKEKEDEPFDDSDVELEVDEEEGD